MRVTLVDPDLDERPSGTGVLAPKRTGPVPEVVAVSVAPPLAVRPVEDADWTFHN